uniref:zinc finger protein ZFAT n=1 Tax=Centroberyx gerrardi TaxID=166262 RepID=UPI003AB012D7
MDGHKAAGSMFMCRLCNLFSPSRSQLLTHCSQLHPQQEPPDDIIIALQPLPAGSVETLTESPVKRKRGRPKGSTKKRRSDWTEGKTGSAHSPEEKDKREEERRREERDRQGESHDGTLGLECRKCHRSFSNRRQILKHICLKDEEEEEEENGSESVSGGAGAGGSGSLDLGGGADPSQTHQNPARPGLMRAKEVDGCRAQRTNRRSRMLCDDRSPASKEGGLGNRKPVISVVLAEHETLPGATKMVPVEASPAETESAASQAQPQDSATCQTQTQDAASQATACHDNPKTDPEPSPNPANKTTAASRGFQEYSIKQDATSLIQSQLKIFTCEFCNKIFKFRHSLIAHLRTHTQEKPFQCPHCDYASAIKANLNVHLRKHTGEKFSCQHCPFTCLSPGHLKVHIERVHLKVKQHCGFCQKKYSDVKNLLKHMEQRHNLKDPAVHQSYQQLRLKTRQGQRQLLYHCPTCNRRFKNQLERERHLLVHGPQRPFACLLCDHAATKMAALAAHVRKHLFLYVCCRCRGKFVSSQRLKSHLKESHPDLDQEQAFTDCINNSYYLIQPGGDGWREGQEDRRGKEDGRDEEMREEEEGILLGRREEDRREEEGQDENRREEDRRNAVGGEEWRDGEGERLKAGAREERAQEEEEERANCQDERTEEEQRIEGETGKKGELENGCSEPGSQGTVHQKVSIETTTPTDRQEGECMKAADWSEATAGEKSQDSTADTHTPVSENTHRPEENTHTSLSSENIHTPAFDNTYRTQENTRTPLLENTHPADENTHAAKNTHTSSSSENTDTPDLENTHTPPSSDNTQASPVEDSLTPHSDKVSEAVHQTAFQQVVSSLQKTQLNMETFQRLRKIYGDLECQYCGKLFWYKVHYNLHVRTHTKEHVHYCSQCSYSSITKSCLKRHLVQKHSGLLLPCPNAGCKYTTPDKYKLQAHLRTHQEQGKSVACPVCHQSYPEHRLKNHIKTSHPDTGSVQGKGLMVKRAEKCPYCDSYFLKNSSDLQQHIWAHQGLKPYRCSVCDYAGRSKSNLKTHMNRHSTERSHLCDLCGKKFKSKVTLKSHRLSHTAEGKQFHCSECDYTSVSKPALLRHMEQHAEFKPFRCAHCHYSCNIAGPLKRHYSKKHPDQEYQNAGPGLPNPDTLEQQGGMKCPVCEFVYGTKWELNRHLKNKHNLKLVDTGQSTWEVVETVEEQYVPVEDEEQQTEAAVAALQDSNSGAVNILQQIIELGSESHDAVASVVTMAPGTVTVVEQVADEQQAGNRSDQLMVVDGEEGRTGDQVMVVEEADGLEALTVFTQGDNTHHYIVYVQEQTVEIN